MAIIVDGHNLIPKIQGISLSDPDDEEKLILLLNEYCRIRRKDIEVYFDGAQAGWAGIRSFGRVRAHFVRETHKGNDADLAIIAHLNKIKKRARNETVVSSDGMIGAAVRRMGAKLISSEDFARDLMSLADKESELDPRQQPLGENEIKEWEKLFTQRDDDSKEDNKYNK